MLAGRGFGKTRTGAEWVRGLAESGRCRRIALVARTAADARDVMVEGESGILSIAPRWRRPDYQPSKRRLVWPNGALASIYTADEPDLLRGPQHDAAWCDELASWRYAEAWDNLLMGLRLGDDPRAIVTTTPRPTKEVKELAVDPTVVVTKGTSYENRANLADAFFETIIARYEGTRLGRQEIMAEILDDNPNALWRRVDIDDERVRQAPPFSRVVVAIDPAISSEENAAETGIVAAGIGAIPAAVQSGAGKTMKLPHGFVLGDYSIRGTPQQWADAAVTAYYRHEADRIVAEANQGGEMVKATIRSVDPNVPVKLVHASRGKQTRAEPIASLYEQHRIHHVGTFPELEDQMCQWDPTIPPSPDRMDALVWALSELMLKAPVGRAARSHQG